MPGADGTPVIDAYLEAWNVADVRVRHDLLSAALADGAELHAPTGTFRGPGAIAGLVEAMRSRMPGAEVVRIGDPWQVGDLIRFRWEIRTPSGGVLLRGVDEVERGPDGRLTLVRMVLGEDS